MNPRSLILLVSLFLATSSAFAHHSIAAEFDPLKLSP